jgi:hypothetical protein
MKLHELSPAEGSKKSVKRIGRGTASGQVRLQAKAKKVKNPVQVTADALVLKVVRCHFKEEFLREDLTTSSLLNMLS